MLTALQTAQAVCATGACVTAGPRRASVETAKSALLGPLPIKRKRDPVTPAPVPSLITALALVNSASIPIDKLDVYIAVRAEGRLSAVDAVGKAVALQVAPGVPDACIGAIPGATFFNRARTLSGADVD